MSIPRTSTHSTHTNTRHEERGYGVSGNSDDFYFTEATSDRDTPFSFLNILHAFDADDPGRAIALLSRQAASFTSNRRLEVS